VNRVRDPQQIKLALSESVARYVLVLLDVDDYEHSPNDYETAKLRRSIQQQLARARQQPAQTGGPMPADVKATHECAVIEQSKTSVAVLLSSEQILTVIEHLHACYDYCAAWKEPAQQDDRADNMERQR
jgi:hypothetical protein